MKRLLTFGALFLCSLLTFAQFSGSGSGTESDPYRITNAIHLNQLRNFLNKENVYFKLMSNIDLEDFLENENPSQGWQPVGTPSVPFKGILDGNGKTISGLWINRGSSDQVGFFGSLNGTVKDLTLKGSFVKGKDNVGFLAGTSIATISNCKIEGNVNGNSQVGGCIGYSNPVNMTNVSFSGDVIGISNYVGGIIGKAESTGYLTDCKFTGDKISGINYVGGICGSNNGSNNHISSCVVHTNIVGNDSVGGICGYANNNSLSNISNCGFVGDIVANSYIGGICGEYTGRATMSGCYVISHITGSGNGVGGLVGSSKANYYNEYNNNILNSYFSGSVSGNNEVGGLIGYKFSGNVKYCYSNAIVSGRKSVGGLCGKVEGNYNYNLTIASNVAIISSAKATESNIGRIYGEKGSYVNIGSIGTTDENKAYNRTIVIKAGVVQEITDGEQNGTGVSSATLKLKATYIGMGWDFTNTWTIQETECYPYMKAQTATPIITSQVVSGATAVSGKCIDGGTIILEIDGVKQQLVSSGNIFSFDVAPLQAGHEVRVSAKATDKEDSYQNIEVVSFLGKGTEASPYQVYTAADMCSVYRRGYYKLMNDIDLTSYINQYGTIEGWESIGREGSETIHFDGDGHKISGLWCNSTRDNTGLFSCFANGTIKNLTVETATGKQVKGGSNTGILIGKLINGEIENCKVIGNLADGTPVGGIVGMLDGGIIKRSQASVIINTTGDDTYVGGLVGVTTNGEIDQCVTQGSITATGNNSQAGGLIGKNNATVSNCYSNLEIDSKYCAGGIIAYNYGLVEKCYATGNLISHNYAAGVIGYNDGSNAIIRNCVAMNNKITVLFESQSAQNGGYGQRVLGGFKNEAPEPELNNYALKTMQVSDGNNIAQIVYDDIMNGVAKTGDELMTATTYQELGWNFTDCWAIETGEGYPSLKNNPAEVYHAPEPEPDPQPVVSVVDVMSVANVTATLGETVGIGITLENQTTNLTAFQFDLVLPEGITLAKENVEKYLVTKTSRYSDEGQSLSISLLDNNTYRFVCFSLSNGVIEGGSGAILNAILEIASDMKADIYTAKIQNIIFTQIDGTQISLNNAIFNITVIDYTKGDANGDKQVNVSDIVEIVNSILGKPSDKFIKIAADMNNDNDINVTDVVMVVQIILSSNTANARRMMAKDEMSTDNDKLTLIVNGDNTLSLNLENQGNYVAAQFDINITDGQKLNGITLNGKRCSEHMLTYSEIGTNLYRVMVYSLANNSFDGNDGELLNISIDGGGDITIDNILFVTESQKEKRFSLLSRGTTGIEIIKTADTKADIYTIDGRLVRIKAESTNGLAKGVYIINGKKHVVK